MSRSSIGTVLTWLGGATVLFALGALALAAYLYFGTLLTDNLGQYDDMLHILWPVGLAGVPVGFVMLCVGVVLHPLWLGDNRK